MVIVEGRVGVVRQCPSCVFYVVLESNFEFTLIIERFCFPHVYWVFHNPVNLVFGQLVTEWLSIFQPSLAQCILEDSFFFKEINLLIINHYTAIVLTSARFLWLKIV